MTQYEVIGVGNALVDMLAQISDSFLIDRAMPKGAMTLVSRDQSHALYTAICSQTDQITQEAGGSAANTIAGLASLGVKTAFTGKIAADSFGQAFQDSLAAHGVAFKSISASPTANIDSQHTGQCLVMVTPDAERTMATYLGVGVDLALENLDIAAISASKIAYLEGYLFDKLAAKTAFAHIAQTICNTGGKAAISLSDPFCVERQRVDFLALIQEHIDLVFANESEIMALYETDDLAQALARIGQDTPLAVITCGAQGAIAVCGTAQYKASALPISNLVDTTGAGDSFAAGFLYGFLREKTLPICLEMGCAAAAEVITQMGPRPKQGFAQRFKRFE